MKQSKKRFLALLLAVSLMTQSGVALATDVDIGESADITEEIVIDDGEAVEEETEPAVDTQEETLAEQEIAVEDSVQAITVDDNVASGTCGTNLTWTLDDAGTLTISGTGAMTNYSDEDDESPWSWNDGIQTVVIMNGVTSIGEYAFYYCSNLTSVEIPASVKSIGSGAFSCCSSLTSVTIPDSVTSIDGYTFRGCSSLTSVTIPNSVTSIGNSTFSSCSSLTSVTIPNSVTSIGSYAFYDCSSLTSVMIPNSVTSISSWTFGDCSNLTSVTIPNSVTSIGEYAFSWCTSLTSVTIPDSVTSIENSVFYDCSSLTSISVANGNPAYSSQDGVLYDKTKSIIIQYPIGNGRSSFAIPNSVASIGEDTFSCCESLTSVTIPNSVTSIGDSAFSSCSSLMSVEIPDSVTSIGFDAFSCCSSLTSVAIPNSVTSIGDLAFDYCTGLKDVYYTGSEAEWKAISIGTYNSPLTNATIHYNWQSAPHTHNWDSGKVTKAATCTATGVKTYTCTGCGAIKTETIAKLTTHTWDSGKVTKAATCGAAGVKTYTCSHCKTTKTETIPATGNHTYKTTTTKAKLGTNGKVVTKCSVCGTVKSTTTIYAPKTLTLSKTSYTYNGKTQKPTVKVKDSKGNTISSSNYTISYASGRKNVGKYKVTVAFKSTSSKYSGTLSAYFTINPKGTTLKTPTAGSKSFTAKWTKLTTQTTGYQIQYSTNSKFTSAKTVTITSNKTTSKKITKLTAKKKYYVRIRTYKTVSGTKYYSAWSSTKTVTTKK